MEFAIVIAVITGMALLFKFLFGLHKKQQAELAASLTQAGFQSNPQIDSSLAESLQGVSARRAGKAETFKNLYRYSGLNYDLYRYDVPGNESDTTHYAMDFRADLFPAFVTVPNVKLPGFLGGMVNKLFQLAFGRSDLKEVEVPGKPRFQEKYRLYGGASHELLSAIPAHVWERFAELPGHLCLSGQGRVLQLTAMVPLHERKVNHPKKDVRSMVEAADALWRVFSEVRPQRVAV